ncbi:hypothetical protein SAMN04489712_105214 [Thermomonospora echinospora]|uniref:Response regulator receiver protein n=1 Tax=Thermomonospora echinospora TaxID=1992 RepID=A0A1H6A4S4_9ACTN|nr:response regulator receiver protein [Thermomonospora echinospora]SEG43738.1 hypothetical protein SAMN04489712_105214 [Thermomonospora echinospora]
MSSGVEADIALDAAVVLSLGMTRVAGRAAGLTAAGAQALAALAQGRADARAAALAEAERQDRAVREVIDRNARIAVLAEAQRETGTRVPLPAPLPPGDGSPEELAAWCAATDRALAEAERRIREQAAAGVAAKVFGVPADGLRADLDAPAPAPGDVGRADQAGHRAETLVRVLARLAPDTAAADREFVAEAAGRLPGAATDAEAEALLTEVRLRVQTANERTAERREAERRQAAERDAAEQAEAERRYVLDAVTTAFEELGYEVDAGFETLTARDGTVVLSRGGWPDHSVKMRVEDARTIRAAMVRTRAPRSEDDRRRDAEREREWCAAFEAARERLAAAGIDSTVTWRIEPGDHELPVAAQARQTRARTRQRARERGRERES